MSPPTAVYLKARFELDGHGLGDVDNIADLFGEVYDSAFRRSLRLRPKPEAQLRTLARQQAQQGAGTHHQAITSPEALRTIAAIPVKAPDCPGQFGDGGVWQEHCKISTEGNGQ